jgi:hypothetical protein
VVRARLRRHAQFGAQEGRADFGDELLARVAVIAETLR